MGMGQKSTATAPPKKSMNQLAAMVSALSSTPDPVHLCFKSHNRHICMFQSDSSTCAMYVCTRTYVCMEV